MRERGQEGGPPQPETPEHAEAKPTPQRPPTGWAAGLPGSVEEPSGGPLQADPAWEQVAEEIHRETDGSLERLQQTAVDIAARRQLVARELRAAGLDARLALLCLSPLPAAVGVIGYLVAAADDDPVTIGVLGWIGVAAAALLTVAGGLWLWRLSRPPFAALPARWRAYEEQVGRDRSVADTLERAWLYAVAGLPLAEALSAALPDDDHPVARLVERLRAASAEGSEPAKRPATRGLPGWATVILRGRVEEAEAADVLDAASEQVHAEHLAEARRSAGRLPLTTVVPFLMCILPATALAVIVTWL